MHVARPFMFSRNRREGSDHAWSKSQSELYKTCKETEVTTLKRTERFTWYLYHDNIERMLSLERNEPGVWACFVVYAAAMRFPWRQSILEEPNQPPIVSARVMHPFALTCVLVCWRCFFFSFGSITRRPRVFEHAVCFVAFPGVSIFT